MTLPNEVLAFRPVKNQQLKHSLESSDAISREVDPGVQAKEGPPYVAEKQAGIDQTQEDGMWAMNYGHSF